MADDEAPGRTPMTLSALRAQPAAVATLNAALGGGRLAHAYLFAGPSGVGKQQAALALACAKNCPDAPGKGCGRCDVCKRIWEGHHPDIRVIPPRDEGNRNLQVDFVREQILPFTQFAPFEAQAALLIFPDADVSFPLQHAEAANALLKAIEEPRPGVGFILLSARPDRLLTTIRSRCQRVRFGPLPRELILDILAAHDTPPDERQTAAALCLGQADRALSLASEGRAAALLDAALSLDDAARARRPGALLDAAESLARRDDRDMVLDTLCLLYRDVAAAALDASETLLFSHRGEEIAERARQDTAADAARRFAAVQGLFAALERNANPEIALGGLLFSL